jgi:hypothetical protein
VVGCDLLLFRSAALVHSEKVPLLGETVLVIESNL